MNKTDCKNAAAGFGTFGFDLESSPDQSKEGGIEGDRAVAVQRHVHANQPLQERQRKRNQTKQSPPVSLLAAMEHLARSPMGAEFAETKRRLDASQQSYHVQVFNSAPARSDNHLLV